MGGVELDELCLRVLAPALRRDVGDRALDDLEQGLLHTFAGHVARNGRVVAGLARGLVQFVDIDNAFFSPRDVEIGGLQQAQQNILDILSYIPGLGQGRGISNAEGDVESSRQGLGQQGLAAAGGTDEQDVALIELDSPRPGVVPMRL